ncbi:MAG TPA: PA14 domain-containing protein, partial [Candidatus Polarisedimenticolia bacterium]|nr:PA14 domain-containing protein [Candidatus Polarisedimenticolia bacterium]
MSAPCKFFVIGLVLPMLAGVVVRGDSPVLNLKSDQTFEGTVTLVDTNRDLLVLQHHDHAIPVKIGSFKRPLEPGQRIEIEGKVSPYFTAFPDYPDHPSGREVDDSFEAPTDWAKHYLTRMRGFLRPPADGEYTFWIAADDEGELLLSPDQDPAHAKKVAFAPRATWPKEWDRYRQQESEPIFLHAGQTYYIEAIQRQWRGHDCLAVAWQGPGIKQSVIDRQYLLPDLGGLPGPTNGILREYWTNFFVTTLSMLVPEPQEQLAGTVSEPLLKIVGTNALPKASVIHIGEPWSEANNFRWVEVEGISGFVANNNGNLTLELTNDAGRMTMHVFNWGTNSTVALEDRKLRVRGVCEAVTSEKGEVVAGTIWVPDPRQIDLLDFTDNDWSGLDPVPIYDLVPSNPNLAWGRRVLVRGTILEHDPEAAAVPVQGDDSFYGFISDDGANWNPIGVPVSLAVGNTAFAGMAVSSMANNPLPAATFDQGRQTLDTARFASIGASGGIQYSNATFTMQVHSGGIDETEENCNFLFQPLPGEGELVARLDSFQGQHVSDKAGIMIRESLDEDSPSVALMVTPEQKISLQYQARGGISRVVSLVLNKTPHWLKLVRRRHLLTVYPRQSEQFLPHQAVEIAGNLTWEDNLPALTEAYLRPMVNSTAPFAKVTQSSKPEYIRIKDLPAESEEGSLRYASRSFRVRGVVTFSDRAFNRNLIFIQDDSGGAMVRVLPEMVQFKPLIPGQFVEAEGTIKFSHGAAPLGIGSATVLGLGQMPSPLPFPDRGSS